ncbi:MAG: hypothetical protein ACR2QC_03640 [Gammaproteobacteria bacterium]
MNNFDAQFKKVWAILEKTAEDHKRREAEADKRAAEHERWKKDFDRRYGGFINNYAESLEDEFADAMEDEMRVGDIPLHEVKRNVGARYEYDIAAINGDCVAVGEIKHKLLSKDVVKFAEERLPYFAADCPLLAEDRKVLGMVGGASVAKDARKEAAKRGLLVLRLKNKKLVVENAADARPMPQSA